MFVKPRCATLGTPMANDHCRARTCRLFIRPKRTDCRPALCRCFSEEASEDPGDTKDGGAVVRLFSGIIAFALARVMLINVLCGDFSELAFTVQWPLCPIFGAVLDGWCFLVLLSVERDGEDVRKAGGLRHVDCPLSGTNLCPAQLLVASTTRRLSFICAPTPSNAHQHPNVEFHCLDCVRQNRWIGRYWRGEETGHLGKAKVGPGAGDALGAGRRSRRARRRSGAELVGEKRHKRLRWCCGAVLDGFVSLSGLKRVAQLHECNLGDVFRALPSMAVAVGDVQRWIICVVGSLQECSCDTS